MFQNFPFRFRRRQRIRRLKPSPHNSITRWLKEKKKTVTTDPIKRKRKTTKEKKIGVKNLQIIISQLYLKVNEIVEFIQDKPEELEKMLMWEIKTREEQITLLEAKHDKEMEELETKLTRLIRNNRRLIAANTLFDIEDRKNLQFNWAADWQLRTEFEMHKSTPLVTPWGFPLTHYPGARFEKGGRTKPKPLTKSEKRKMFRK